MEFLKVNNEDIEGLSDRELTELLSILLYFEADKSGIASNAVSVALNITVPDGGEDGRIKWNEGIANTNWLPNRFTFFQCKATDMPPSKCEGELLSSNKKVKPRVKEVIESKGSYILFHSRTLNEQQQAERIKYFRKAINKSGHENIDIDIKVYDASKIAAWTNESISAVVAVWKWCGKYLPYGAKTWKEWSGYQDNSFDYVLDTNFSSYITQLRSHLNGVKKVARIVGLSGIGKTRLAFEAYRPPEDNSNIEQLIRSRQVVYLDAATSSLDLPSVISTWRSLGLKGTIIVDNCTPDMHASLRNEVEHTDSKLNLLTLDFNPERFQADHPYIEIKQVSNEVIKGIIKQGFSGISESDIERIVEFAQGFPKIAVLLAKSRINQEDDIGSLRDDVLVEKLLWGRDTKDSIKYKVISACALFDYLGYTGEVSIQRKFVTENICRLEEDEFYEACQYFIERGILDVRGRFIKVTPLPLAIRLAADWWKSCPPEKAQNILTSRMPNGMAEALCDQIAKLHFLPKAKELTLSLCAKGTAFGQVEVLNSEEGSRLFRSLVEVNPEATVNALDKVFGEMNIKQLLEIGPGRRNLVWSLEKLCFWEKTFEKAARILLLFAAAENESWGNNATAQFLQLFHFRLSGTQASPRYRMNVIDYALYSNIPEVRVLGVEALGHVLEANHFSRMIGVEKQGSRPVQEEWKPRNYGEVFDYWKDALERLTEIAIDNKELSQNACNKIAENIRGLLSYGRVDDLEFAIKKILNIKGNFWPEALGTISDTIRYDGSKMTEKERERLQTWQGWMQPESFMEQLRLRVSIPEWDHLIDEETGKYIDVAAQKAKKFANETLEKHYHELIENLSEVLQGEQRQGNIYGNELGRLIKNPNELITSIIKSLQILHESEIEYINLSFVGGVLKALQEKDVKEVEEFFNQLLSVGLYGYIVELTRFINITKSDLDRILKLLQEKSINSTSLMNLSYGSALKHFEPEIILEFISEINNRNEDLEAISVSWQILYMYTHGDREKFIATALAFKNMLLCPGLLKSKTIDKHRIEDVLDNFYNLEVEGMEELTELLAQEIVQCLSSKLNYGETQNLRCSAHIVLKNGWEVSWPIFSKALLSEDTSVLYNIIDVLEPEFLDIELFGANDWSLSHVPTEVLKLWCFKNDKGPELLSSITPALTITGDEQIKMNEIAEFLIEQYGSNQKVLNNISRQLNAFGWSGSLIPYYEQRISIYKMFEKHKVPNVRIWAVKWISYLVEEIEREKLKEEENKLGM